MTAAVDQRGRDLHAPIGGAAASEPLPLSDAQLASDLDFAAGRIAELLNGPNPDQPLPLAYRDLVAVVRDGAARLRSNDVKACGIDVTSVETLTAHFASPHTAGPYEPGEFTMDVRRE